MTGNELKARLHQLDFTQMSFARRIGVSGSTVRAWIDDDNERQVPRVVELLVNLMLCTGTNATKLAQLDLLLVPFGTKGIQP